MFQVNFSAQAMQELNRLDKIEQLEAITPISSLKASDLAAPREPLGRFHRAGRRLRDRFLGSGASASVGVIAADLAGRAVPGTTVTVKVASGGEQPALLVPQGAIGVDQNRKFVYLVGPDQRVAYRQVVFGRQVGDRAKASEMEHAIRAHIREHIDQEAQHGAEPVLAVLCEEHSAPDRNRRADRLRMAHPGDDLHRIGFNLHPAATPEPLLAPPQFTIHALQGHRNAGRQTRQGRDETLAVRLTRRFKAEH